MERKLEEFIEHEQQVPRGLKPARNDTRREELHGRG
jgi:hypothetical protein